MYNTLGHTIEKLKPVRLCVWRAELCQTITTVDVIQPHQSQWLLPTTERHSFKNIQLREPASIYFCDIIWVGLNKAWNLELLSYFYWCWLYWFVNENPAHSVFSMSGFGDKSLLFNYISDSCSCRSIMGHTICPEMQNSHLITKLISFYLHI